MKCIICNNDVTRLEDKQMKLYYEVCSSCGFIHKPKAFQLSKVEEKTEYNRHNNSHESIGYVTIFKELIKNYIEPLGVKGNVLEFGSGPGPVLRDLLMEKKELDVYHYDPFYFPDESYKEKTYNLITTTEVVEHFFDPITEFTKLVSLLKPGGYLLIMTKFRNMDQASFLNWWYRRDITHVSFYNMQTFRYLMDRFKLNLHSTNHENIIIFQKQ